MSWVEKNRKINNQRRGRLLGTREYSMPVHKWTEQYNAKRGSVKDYMCFFYQYSEFHVFTRQSSVENSSIAV